MRGKKVVEKKEQLKMYVVVQKQYIESEEEYKGISMVHVATEDLEVAKAITARMRGDYYTIEVPFITEPAQWEKWPLREDVIRRTALAKLTEREREVLGL